MNRKKLLWTAVIAAVLVLSSLLFAVFASSEEPMLSSELIEDKIELMGAYDHNGNLLPDLEGYDFDYKALGEHIREGLLNEQTVIPIYEAGFRVNNAIFKYYFSQYIVNTYNGELAYVSPNYSWNYFSNSQEVYRLSVKYFFTGEERISKMAEYDAIMSRIVNLASHLSTPLEKVIFYHEYMVSNLQYDIDYEIYDAYQMVTKGKGVCQAYTSVLAELLRRSGIESVAVLSNIDNHVWNAVKIDGEWFHVDATWDDPLSGGEDRPGRVYHSSLLRSHEGIISAGHTEGFVPVDGVSYEFSSRYDNAKWGSLHRPMHVYDGKLYYIDDESYKLSSLELESMNTTSLLYVYAAAYYHGGSSYYAGIQSGFCGYGDKVYFSEQKKGVAEVYLYEYDIPSGEKTLLLTKSCEKYTFQSIYGLFSDGNTIYWFFADDPNTSTGTVYSMTVDEYSPLRLMDVNGDGMITNVDVTVFMRYLSGWSESGFKENNADVTADGKINNRDAIALIRYLAA